MRDTQHDLHLPNHHQQNDITDQLNECRQQLKRWNLELADTERRLTVFRERQQMLQTQLEIVRREHDYLRVVMEEHERKQRAWQETILTHHQVDRQ